MHKARNVGRGSMPSQLPRATNIHLDSSHFPQSHTSAALHFWRAAMFHAADLMLHDALLIVSPHHGHHQPIEVIKLVIVFFCSLAV